MSTMGIYVPPAVNLSLSGSAMFSGGAATATIAELRQYAGAAIGSARVIYKARYARDAAVAMEARGVIRIGSQVAFRGVVGHGPYQVANDSDELELVLFDDKWPMSSRVVGQVGIGTVAGGGGVLAGFPDVGFDVTFNKDGRPNKDPAALNFSTGTGAAYWTLAEAMRFVFLYYVSNTVATLDVAELAGAGYLRTPTHLNLVGKNALQAVDMIVSMAGESWTLLPGDSASTFKAVKAGAGTVRTIQLFDPRANHRAGEAGDYAADSFSAGSNLVNVRDVHQAVSAPIVRESTLTSGGTDPMLVKKTAFKDSEYDICFEVDVTKYLANALGFNLSAGSPPKPWLPRLLTRVKDDRSGYYTAAELAAVPARQHNPCAEIAVWVSLDGSEAGARLVTEGVRIDHEEARIMLKKDLGLRKKAVSGTKQEGSDTLSIDGITKLVIWATVATVGTLPQYNEQDEDILETPMVNVIQKTDLVPERRYNSWLPDLSSAEPNTIVKHATTAEEVYVDIATRLEEVATSAAAQSPNVEKELRFTFPFLPRMQIGDRIQVSGRNIGASGSEVVTSLIYDGDRCTADVTASDVLSGVTPEAFWEKEL